MLAELVPLANPDTGKPLDMTFCALRGVSIMYAEYLRNIGVAAALMMAIRRNGELWGLIACHHYAGPKHVPYQIRPACEFLAQVVTLQHQAAEDKEHAAYGRKIEGVHRQLVDAVAREGGLASLTTGTPSLLDGLDAGGVAESVFARLDVPICDMRYATWRLIPGPNLVRSSSRSRAKRLRQNHSAPQ